jgi:hypothetical protein
MTFQRPTYEEVTIAHDGSVIVLRPSLRAAATLVDRHGFPALYEAMDDFNVTIICEIITAASSSGHDAAAFLGGNLRKPLLPFFLAVRQPLIGLVTMLMPAPVQPVDTSPASDSKPMPWTDVYEHLYATATGWLGWTPETTWNATPTEISRAMSAHFDRLVTTGVLVRDKEAGTRKNKTRPEPDQAANNVAEGLDPAFDRAGLRSLKARISGGEV